MRVNSLILTLNSQDLGKRKEPGSQDYVAALKYNRVGGRIPGLLAGYTSLLLVPSTVDSESRFIQSIHPR